MIFLNLSVYVVSVGNVRIWLQQYIAANFSFTSIYYMKYAAWDQCYLTPNMRMLIEKVYINVSYWVNINCSNLLAIETESSICWKNLLWWTHEGISPCVLYIHPKCWYKPWIFTFIVTWSLPHKLSALAVYSPASCSVTSSTNIVQSSLPFW